MFFLPVSPSLYCVRSHLAREKKTFSRGDADGSAHQSHERMKGPSEEKEKNYQPGTNLEQHVHVRHCAHDGRRYAIVLMEYDGAGGAGAVVDQESYGRCAAQAGLSGNGGQLSHDFVSPGLSPSAPLES